MGGKTISASWRKRSLLCLQIREMVISPKNELALGA
jgi:hypothetical protein